MGTVSVNNLWSFIQGLSLSSTDRQWLAGKLLEPGTVKVQAKEKANEQGSGKKYIISPRRRKLMGSVVIDPKDIDNDERAKYILSK